MPDAKEEQSHCSNPIRTSAGESVALEHSDNRSNGLNDDRSSSIAGNSPVWLPSSTSTGHHHILSDQIHNSPFQYVDYQQPSLSTMVEHSSWKVSTAPELLEPNPAPQYLSLNPHCQTNDLSGSVISDHPHPPRQNAERHGSAGVSPDVLTDDGIFGPGSTYQELHLALRKEIFQSTQPQPRSSQSSTTNTSHTVQRAESNSATPELTTKLEALLWNNWISEIAPWMDKFDHDTHFQHTLPALAQTTLHLKCSLLALSARQLERKTGDIPSSTSLGLYQCAIHLLLPLLHLKDTSILASCVLLCVLEMGSCSPKAWRRHLDGCANLIRSMGIRGDCGGGLEQALFWCFARMDVCGALISTTQTLIPCSEWLSNLQQPYQTKQFEDHASRACFLLAKVLELLDDWLTADRDTASDHLKRNWISLFDELKQWQLNLSLEMLPVFSHSGSTDDNPFPTVIYSNGAAVSGNQLWHTAMLIMLRRKPTSIKVESRSMLWHARHICGISQSNAHHGAWVNSIQPLWIAGRLMSSPAEHCCILELFAKIEKETGWNAAWRAADLREYWGDLT